jgi:alkanesulfonate monooxygenase SsuD/methylene tetrahydromethanopterin reductase-like flavin-dependent oxidoreductase (luciferase family)
LVAGWADGLITVNQPAEKLKQVIEAFRTHGGEGKPMFLQAHVAWAPSESEALAQAHAQWRTNVFTGSLLWDVPRPADLDAAARYVQPEDLRDAVRISADLGQQLAWLHEDQELGFERVYLHEVGRDQQRFIEVFGERVLPKLT